MSYAIVWQPVKRLTQMSARRRPVRLAPDAQRDYDDILLYSFLTWGEAQMRRYRAALDRGLDDLGDFPEIGRPRDHFFQGCRSLQVERHELFYRITPGVIEVVRILHEKQDAMAAFRDRPPE